jgi:hypothetical protein
LFLWGCCFNVFCVLVTYPPGRRPGGEFSAVQLYKVPRQNSHGVECRPFNLCETEWLSERSSSHIYSCICCVCLTMPALVAS